MSKKIPYHKKDFYKRYGLSNDQSEEISAIVEEMILSGKPLRVTPVHAYVQQKVSARKRNIEFSLNFWEWWCIWKESGKWNERGLGFGYVMCRKMDYGAYEKRNVFIDTAINNASKSSFKKSSLPTGVTFEKKKYRASRIYKGKRYHLGLFDTPEEAGEAYLRSLKDGPPNKIPIEKT